MAPTIQADPVPLSQDEHGAIRVGDSRVLLDVVIEEFEKGASPEGIVHGYSTLQLADVYAVIAYYLRHRNEVQAYLRRREEEAEQVRRRIEARQPPRPGFRDELLKRRAEAGGQDAPSGQ